MVAQTQLDCWWKRRRNVWQKINNFLWGDINIIELEELEFI